MTVTVIERCQFYIYLKFFIISKDDFTKVKNYLNLIHDGKQYTV